MLFDIATLTDEPRTVRDGLLDLQDRNANNTVRQEYTWGLNLGGPSASLRTGGIGGLLDMKQGGVHYSYFYDGKGNVEAVLDWEKNVAAAYRYDPFGRLLAKTGALDQPFQFSTKRFDALTGLAYYGYRFYSPEMGRWTTRDPLGEAGGINLYAFVGNNPVNWVDPWGLIITNNSPYTIFYKPGEPGSTEAFPIAPGETFEGEHDGIAIPCVKPGEIFKNVDGIDVTVNKDGTVDTSGGTIKQKVGQAFIGGWNNGRKFQKKLHKKKIPDHGWDKLIKKSEKENCK